MTSAPSPTAPSPLGIAEVAEITGLSVDALRWYEREGLVPRVARDHQGRRRYDEASLGFVQMVVRLRRTGMPVADVRQYLAWHREGASTHRQRLALLEQHRTRVRAQLAAIQDDLEAITYKIEHYAEIISNGCHATTRS